MSPLFSRKSHIDRETAYDVLVNLIPMGILFFFIVMFAIVSPWGFDLGISLLSHFLMIFPFLSLGILTYVSARVISRDEDLGPRLEE